MDKIFIVAQAFGILGLIFNVLSFQAKRNKMLFVTQAIGGISFAINFILIGDIASCLFNLMNLVRGVIFIRSKKRIWEIMLVEAFYVACFAFSVSRIWGSWFDISLSLLTFISLVTLSFVMWKGNPRYIRYTQLCMSSPAWIVNNIFHFTLGGLLCEIFSMCSVVISLIRFRKTGFEEN